MPSFAASLCWISSDLRWVFVNRPHTAGHSRSGGGRQSLTGRYAVAEVGDGRGLDHPGAVERAPLGSEMVLEQPDAVAEEHGGDVDLKLVEQPRLEVLLSDGRATANRDVLVTRCRPRLLERGFDAVGDEGERRSSL